MGNREPIIPATSVRRPRWRAAAVWLCLLISPTAVLGQDTEAGHPLLMSPHGLPFGVQAVGPVDDDARLFRHARWLIDVLNAQN